MEINRFRDKRIINDDSKIIKAKKKIKIFLIKMEFSKNQNMKIFIIKQPYSS